MIEHSQHWEHLEKLEQNKKIDKDTSRRTEKNMVDSATCVEKIMVECATCTDEKEDDIAPTVLDIHGCKYFGQLVSNELLRFKPDERNIKMQKILDLIKK